jgi:hypothetical protein
MRAIRFWIVVPILAFAALLVPVVLAQQESGEPAAAVRPKPQLAPAAPVPAPIFSAKKVFVSNAGGDSDISPDHYSGGPERPYNQFYAAMKSWGRYDLAASPEDAELVFELHFTAPRYGSGATSTLQRPQLRLVILDLKTHVVLWSFIEYLPDRGVTHDQSFDRAMAKLVGDVQVLATPPQSPAKRDDR